MAKKLRIGALISGGGSNLQAIIDACEAQRIQGSVVFVGSDTPRAKGLKRAEQHGIPAFIVDYASLMTGAREDGVQRSVPDDFDLSHILKVQNLFAAKEKDDRLKKFFTTRAMAEAALLKEMERYAFDLLVLAGFMRILTPYFVDRVNVNPEKPRIMNIHPALLPAFPGVDGYGDTFRYGCKVGGCTVHFVDYGEDTGPIIGQKAFEILPEDTIDSIREKGLRMEWELYPACVQLFAEGRLVVAERVFKQTDGSIFRKKAVEILPPS